MLYFALFALAPSLQWDSLQRQSQAAYAQGPGQGAAERRAAFEAGADKVHLVPSGLRGEVQAGSESQAQELLAVELSLGEGVAQRRYWDAAQAATEQDARSASLAWVMEAQASFGGWWLMASLAEHLREVQAEERSQILRLEAASQGGLISSLALEMAQAEVARTGIELREVERGRQQAESQLSHYFGPMALSLEGGAVCEDNPWTAIEPQSLPQVQSLWREADLSRAQAGLEGAARLPTLAAGPMRAQGEVFAYAELSVPLGGGRSSARAVAMGEAEAARLEAEWQAQAMGWELQGWGAELDLIRTQLAEHEAEVLVPLRTRQARLEAGLEAGQLPMDLVLRGRRDLHEAEHAMLELRAQAMLSCTQGRTVLNFVEEL